MSEEKLYPLNIYDGYGKMRHDLDPAEIAKCTKLQQKTLFAVLSSLEVAEKSETVHYEAQKANRRAVTALEKSRKAYETALPKRTFHDEWRETVAKFPPKPVSDATKKAIADALVGIEDAEKHLAECQRAEIATNQDEKIKRATFAKNVIAWSGMDGVPKNVGDLVKAGVVARSKIALDNIAAGLPADYAVAQASTVGPSHLDKFKAGQGRGGSPLSFERMVLREPMLWPTLGLPAWAVIGRRLRCTAD